MPRAVWNGVALADSEHTVELEGKHYFPPESLNRVYFVDSPTRSRCPWKGVARYYTIVVGDQVNLDAAWSYPHPSPLARRIRGHVAFWGGVHIESGREQPTLLDRLLGRAR
jgi:uncharacterized protein (DUF427 family)